MDGKGIAQEVNLQGRRGGWSTDRAQPSDRIFTGGRTGNTVVEQIRRQEVR